MPDPNGNYGYGVFIVEVTDANYCASRDTIEVIEVCDPIIPTVFTPNGDGNNDVFAIQYIETNPDSKMKIYNRWGNEVYSTDHYEIQSNWWDADGAPAGTYYYVLILSNGKNYSGTITVLTKEKD